MELHCTLRPVSIKLLQDLLVVAWWSYLELPALYWADEAELDLIVALKMVMVMQLRQAWAVKDFWIV